MCSGANNTRAAHLLELWEPDSSSAGAVSNREGTNRLGTDGSAGHRQGRIDARYRLEFVMRRRRNLGWSSISNPK